MNIDVPQYYSVIVIGCGGHAKVVMDALHKQNYSAFQIMDDDEEKLGTNFSKKLKVQKIQSLDWWKRNKPEAIIAIGSNQARKNMAMRLAGVRWLNAIHPTALIHNSATLGEGIYIGANVVIQPDTKIGDHCIINTGSIIEHDVTIEPYCHVAPGSIITGGVTLGEGVLLGAGTKVIPNVSIGCWTIIGAGSVVISNILDNQKAYGVPCKAVGCL